MKHNLMQSKKLHPKGQAGFTLIEIITSLTLLAMGISAILMLQASSMKLQKSSRDIAIGKELAEQTLFVLQTDALQWISSNTQTRYFDDSTDRKLSSGANTYWIPFTNAPVNFQMQPSTASDNAGIRANVCIFYSYRWLGSTYTFDSQTLGGGTNLANQVLEVIVTAMWPRNWNGLPSVIETGDTYSYSEFFSTCGNPGGTPDSPNIFSMFFAEGRQGALLTKLQQVRQSTYISKNYKEIVR